ncbi:MAG: hypothetical protein ABIN80_02885 [Dyadobacter sp.]|uniref:hypothetical protein n=1 Tax=Dyadobacter sp. TaxID=1914288 RepID=UPI0032636D7E
MATSITGPANGLNIVTYRGDTFERWIRIKRNGVEENLSPSTYRMQIRNGTQLIKELTSAGLEITIEVSGGGVLVLALSDVVTAALPSGEFIFDMQQTYPNGKVKTRFRGTFTVTEDVTKPIS